MKMKKLCWFKSWRAVVLLVAFLTIATGTTPKSVVNKWLSDGGNNPNTAPIIKHVKLYNEASTGYVTVRNSTVDALETNQSNPETIIRLDMYGPTLLAIRSWLTGRYLCHNIYTGELESKATREPGCLFVSKLRGKYHRYRSVFNATWYIAFFGKGKKRGVAKLGSRTKASNRGTRIVELPMSNLKKRRKT